MNIFGYEIRKVQPQLRPVVRQGKKRGQCKNGHPKDAENTIYVGGQTRCRECYITYKDRRNSKKQ